MIGKYTLNSATLEEERQKNQEHARMVNEQRERNDRRRANYNKFLTESKDFLIVEGMYQLLNKCLPNLEDYYLKSVARNCCENFVREEGAANILRKCKSTLFLNEFCNVVEETYKKIIHGAADNDKCDDFEIANSDMEEYYGKLRKLNYEPMCNTIITRVVEAEKDFVTANMKDKEKMEDAASKAAEKIDSIKAKDEDTAEAIKAEFTNMYKREVDTIGQRRRNILESIVRRMSQNIVTNDEIRQNFIQESGKLNMNKIIDTTEVMYAFLEMVNTTQIKEVDSKYLETVLMSIK